MVRIRELAEGEESLLGEMLYAALFLRPGGERPPIDAVLAHPQGAMYHTSRSGYESLGYVDYEPGDGHGRMLLHL